MYLCMYYVYIYMRILTYIHIFFIKYHMFSLSKLYTSSRSQKCMTSVILLHKFSVPQRPQELR